MFDRPATNESPEKIRIAIVGGGPGGLFAAWHLNNKLGDACEIIIFESDARLGGKIVTRELAGVGGYEAGVAEIYDYSEIGGDPLHDLIVHELNLELRYLEGGPCFLRDKLILSADDLATQFGPETYQDVMRFRRRCEEALSPQDYYLSYPDADNAHPWKAIDGLELLRDIKDEVARQYVRVMAHSDVAAAPFQTNGLTFLKNAVMDLGGYMRICSVEGGNEKIVERLVETLEATIRLNATVRALTPVAESECAQLEIISNGVVETYSADFVVLALPLSALSSIHWRSEALQDAIDRHIRYFDRPAHYLRVVLFFERPFWRDRISAHWWMLDQFDGCCVYDESARNSARGYGVLSFLIAGNAALSLTNVSDARIEQLCLDALPSAFASDRRLLVESRVHRWMASVNALPGGAPPRARLQNHTLDPENAPGVFIVGDYLFDSTLNGVMDSADTATDYIAARVLQKRQDARRAHRNGAASACVETVIDIWRPETLLEMLIAAWDIQKGAKILHFGCGQGRLVNALRAEGYDAYGMEFDAEAYGAAHPLTATECLLHDFFSPSPLLSFADKSFDIIIDTGLYRSPQQQETEIIKELQRVVKTGLFIGSPVIDAPIDLLERYNVVDALERLKSRWDWSEILYAAGFRHALLGAARLDAVWNCARIAGAGPGFWCEDMDGIVYSFYKPL